MILAQYASGYRYNSDTLALYDFIANYLKPNFKGRVLDVGCGCGVLGLLLKRDFKGASVSLIDILEINANLARENALKNSLNVEIFNSDFTKFKSEAKFDLIISNPPFYHDGVKRSNNEIIAISRYASALSLKDFLNCANTNLTPRGELIFCYEAMSLSEVLINLNEFKFTLLSLCFVYPKPKSVANLAIIRAKKSSKSKAEILPAIIMNENGESSQRAKEIFKRADLKSVTKND